MTLFTFDGDVTDFEWECAGCRFQGSGDEPCMCGPNSCDYCGVEPDEHGYCLCCNSCRDPICAGDCG